MYIQYIYMYTNVDNSHYVVNLHESMDCELIQAAACDTAL
jgi:hypothetical protein